MGALRPLRMDSEDARTCIENRFTVFAGFYRFNPDGPENEANLARSVFVQLKHAQNKFCGLRRRFRRALEGGQCAGGRDVVSRETIVISFCFPETILHSGRLTLAFRFSLSF